MATTVALVITSWLSWSSAAAAAEEPADGVAQFCSALANKLGSIDLKDCREAQLEDSGARSVQDRALVKREVAPSDLSLETPRILLFGGIHGDEYSSVSIIFNWLELLEESGSRGFHWLIYPALNPDGLLKSQSERMNARGVDLNRNFPTPDWITSTREYWVDRTGRDPRRYPGPAPLSEPESEWLLREIHRFEPTVIISVHAPYKVLDFDGPADTAPQQIGPLTLRLLGTYPGSLGRYAGVVRRKPVVTLELPSAGILPTEDEQRQMWEDLLVWLTERFPPPPASGSAAQVESEVGAP